MHAILPRKQFNEMYAVSHKTTHTVFAHKLAKYNELW